jgi:uncharacterized peroxidase-related enzyme
MRAIRNVVASVAAMAAVTGAVSCRAGPVSERPTEPVLSLPDVTPATNQLPEQPLWSSTRAWHYNPKMVRPLWDVWEALAEPPLDLRTKTMLAVVTDSRNRCPYCLSAAVCFLEQEGVSEEVIVGLQTDIAAADVSEKEKALLRLAEEITVNPSAGHTRVAAALEAGWTEREVAQAIFVTGYFNMLNRIAEAFVLPSDQDHPFGPAPVFPMAKCAGASTVQ